VVISLFITSDNRCLVYGTTPPIIVIFISGYQKGHKSPLAFPDITTLLRAQKVQKKNAETQAPNAVRRTDRIIIIDRRLERVHRSQPSRRTRGTSFDSGQPLPVIHQSRPGLSGGPASGPQGARATRPRHYTKHGGTGCVSGL